MGLGRVAVKQPPPIRPHLWVMENIVRDEGAVLEYDTRCTICNEVRHVTPEPMDPCPGPD